MLLVAVGVRVNDFGGGRSDDRIVELVLSNRRVKVVGNRRFRVVVDAALGENIGDLQPDTTLAGANRANAFE